MTFEISGYYLELTNICNAKCYYCYNNSGNKKHESIDFNCLKKFLNTIKNDNVRIILSGGEPFFYEDIFRILEMIKEYQLKCTIITNGTCLSEHVLKMLDSNIFTLQMSVNSLKAEVHDSITGVPGSFSSISAAIESVKLHSYATKVIVRFLVQKKNMFELPDIPTSKLYWRADKILLDVLKFSGRKGKEIYVGSLDQYDIYNIYHIFSSLGKEHRKIEIPKLTAICKFCLHNDTIRVFPRVDCYGNIYPCNLFGSDLYCVGNIYHSSPYDIFSDANERLIDFIRTCCDRRKRIVHCAQCFAKDVCYGGCPGLSSMLGDFYVEDPYCKLRKEYFLGKLPK